MKTIHYKGRGEHTVNQLEQIIEQLQKELHLYKSGQLKYDDGGLTMGELYLGR